MIAVCGGEACVENLDGVGGGAEREKGRRSTKSYVSSFDRRAAAAGGWCVVRVG